MKSRDQFGTPEQYYDYLRTYFASQALIGLCDARNYYSVISTKGNIELNGPELVKDSVWLADLLLKELQK